MIGDVTDFISRLRRVLPTRWFGDVAPFVDAVLGSFGVAHAATYGLIESVRAQARLATAAGIFIDMIAVDFFADSFVRRRDESDTSFRMRLARELLRPRGTRAALIGALADLTGSPPTVFEPARPMDTGGYNVGGVGYCVGGGWGNLLLPFQSFVVAERPHGGGIAFLAGYGSGGLLYYGNISLAATAVSDGDIYASAASVIPIGYTTWLRIRS